MKKYEKAVAELIDLRIEDEIANDSISGTGGVVTDPDTGDVITDPDN